MCELEQIVATTTARNDSRSQQLSDEATRLDALAHLSVDARLTARAECDLTLLKRQLERLEQGEFGLCRLCGHEIAANRIATLPATQLCVSCAQEQENKS